MAPILEMRGVTKRFPGVLADDQVDFSLEGGEVHALLGENGAGKSTLMNILYGLYQPDEGSILWQGQQVRFAAPAEALRHGIGMVHQDFQLVPSLTVAENVILGLASNGLFYRAGQVEERIRTLSEHYGIPVDPAAYIWQLPAGSQQRVEIIKALYREAQLLILDEPTSVLTPQETRELFAVLRCLVAENRSVVFISHKLEEVLSVSDRITVLRAGRVTGTVAAAHTNRQELIRMMIGRDLDALSRGAPAPGREVLRLKEVWADGDKRLPALKGVSLTVRGGEILGVAGIAGNGQCELAEVIAGLRLVRSGRVAICGRDTTRASPRAIADIGVAYVPERVRHSAVFGDFSLAHNAILKVHRTPPLARHGLLSPRAIRDHSRALLRTYDVRARDEEVLAGQLSGGNLQKLVLARELSRSPQLIVVAQPTAGLDVNASNYIRQRLLEERSQGRAVLLISADLDELLAVSDRIAVMYGGEIVGQLSIGEANLEELGLLMAGSMRLSAPTPDGGNAGARQF